MPSDLCTKRLTKELASLRKDPIQNPKISVMPNEANLLELHYVVEGSDGTPYANGFYHGKLLFPKEYPLKPPSVIMLTPSGRFQPNRRLCLSMSDFHPETWNPMWSVSTILTGLYSFMLDTAPTLGSIETSRYTKEKLARQSLEYNVKNNPTFCKLFPEYVELYQERLRQLPAVTSGSSILASRGSLSSASGAASPSSLEQNINGIFALSAGVIAIFSIVLAFRFL